MSQVEDSHLEPGPQPPHLPWLLAGVFLKAVFVLTAKITRGSAVARCPAPPWGPPLLPGVPCSSLKSLWMSSLLEGRGAGGASELCSVSEVK